MLTPELFTEIVVLRAQPTPSAGNILPILTIRSPEDVNQFVLGSDIDLGEYYTIKSHQI